MFELEGERLDLQNEMPFVFFCDQFEENVSTHLDKSLGGVSGSMPRSNSATRKSVDDRPSASPRFTFERSCSSTLFLGLDKKRNYYLQFLTCNFSTCSSNSAIRVACRSDNPFFSSSSWIVRLRSEANRSRSRR